MVTKTFAAQDEYTAPIFIPQGRVMAISLSGTFVATVTIQRLIKAEGDSSYPAHNDSGWNAVSAHAAPMEEQIENGDNCWYRAYCTAYTSGSPAIKMRI